MVVNGGLLSIGSRMLDYINLEGGWGFQFGVVCTRVVLGSGLASSGDRIGFLEEGGGWWRYGFGCLHRRWRGCDGGCIEKW
ncbi:hypothetical protein M0R45_032141 [Rubus argutus]|uniref:Uncharacterized protein n=1 Tax=Rubus argutus TaxID=59490 RepID=A0AAW1WI85_RUBAR